MVNEAFEMVLIQMNLKGLKKIVEVDRTILLREYLSDK